MASDHICQINETFFNYLLEQYHPANSASNVWTKLREAEVIKLLNETNLAIEIGRQPSRSVLHFCSLYDILSVDGVERVILKKARGDGSVRVMVPREEFFETINLYHCKLGHVGLDQLHFAVRQRFVIPKRIISIFVNCCNVCSDIKPRVQNLDSPQSNLYDRNSNFQELCVVDTTDVSSLSNRTRQVPQPPPTQKQPALQQPQPQPQKIMPPQQVQTPKPIAPKPPQATQPVSPLQPLPPPPEVCLRWNSYHSNMQATFPSLLNNEQFVDVTLACEGRSIKCHKMMLSACSAYFEELLSQNPCQHPIVLMKDLRYWEVQALVDFMYRGEVNVGQDKLPSLLAAAEALQIKGLAGPAFSSNEDDNSQAAAPASTGEDYLDESIPSPSSARRARKRRVMSSNIPPRVQTPQSQPVPTSPKNTSKRPVKPISVPSTSSSYEIESSSLLSEPPIRRQRKSETDLVGEIKIEPIDIEISNDSMEQMEESFLEKTYDESGGEESNCLSNDPGGTTDSKNIDIGDVKSLHGHETDPMEYGTNNSASGSDHNFKYEDSGSQDANLGPISDMPGTSYQ